MQDRWQAAAIGGHDDHPRILLREVLCQQLVKQVDDAAVEEDDEVSAEDVGAER
ncbi:MAG TPA: hypothetical protein VFA08_01330 [Actinomycetota bacterium]|nr:hypothetical protein [Actinomycetota bacterium]